MLLTLLTVSSSGGTPTSKCWWSVAPRLRLSENNYRLAEEREHLLNQMLLAIRNVNQLIVREQNIDSLLHAACRNLTETLGYHTAWIALFDEGGALSAFASSGLGDAAESFRQKVAERHYQVLKR